MGYYLADTGKETNGINGAIMQRRDPNQPIVNSIDVPNIDEYMKRVEAAGGVIVVPKMTVATMGYNCYFKDTEGNIHGLWQTDPNAK
jgi:predicted enzyme related to lactoylglutathione lyase